MYELKRLILDRKVVVLVAFEPTFVIFIALELIFYHDVLYRMCS